MRHDQLKKWFCVFRNKEAKRAMTIHRAVLT
jgi:hypothetical protein